MERLTSQIGFWSAVLSFVFGMGYIVFQFADWAGLTPQPWPSITLMFPSFWLALAFVILMISIYHYAPDERKIWGHIAVAVAIMYATLNTAVYFVQMTVVFPFTLSGHAGEVDFLRLVGGNTVPSFMYALDALGYSLMSIAMLFSAPVFVGGAHDSPSLFPDTGRFHVVHAVPGEESEFLGYGERCSSPHYSGAFE
jgi:hypothetical protein